MGKKTPLRQVTFICSYMLFFFFAFCWNDRTYRKPHKEIKFNKIQDSSSLQNLLPNLLCRFKKHLWAIPCWNSYRKMPVFNLRKWIWLIIWSTRIYQKMRFNYCKEEIHSLDGRQNSGFWTTKNPWKRTCLQGILGIMLHRREWYSYEPH